MGRVACTAIDSADDLELVGAFARTHVGEPLGPLLGLERPSGSVYADLDTLFDSAEPQVVIDFTLYPATVAVARRAVGQGISPVVGATGWTEDDERGLAEHCQARGVGAALVPNFALGAVLMMRFAEEAARYFPTAEIVELHHDGKRDAPSGTAKLTARRIEAATRRREVPIHSVRLRGLVAHQEVLFGGDGELLTIRHDSLSRESFAAGILLAARAVRSRRGLVVGLDALMKEDGS
jgi:4-hydroxy-tetrahydrodipicolinate reductase